MVLYWKVWKESEKRPFIKLCSSWYPYCAQLLSHVCLFVTTWTVASQAPLFMGFSRQGYWSGFPFPSPGDVPSWGIKPASPVSPTLADKFFITEPPGKPNIHISHWISVIMHDNLRNDRRCHETARSQSSIVFSWPLASLSWMIYDLVSSNYK